MANYRRARVAEVAIKAVEIGDRPVSFVITH